MSLNLKTDVTSVKIHDNKVFAGIGCFVNIFKKDSTKLSERLLCLNGQKIHGFVVFDYGSEILVFGGKQFTILRATSQEGNAAVYTRVFKPVVCDDWLHSAIWIDKNKIAALTAHNVVQIWDIDNQLLISHHCSQDNSILYSGLLLSVGQQLLVMAGTVFSEVIIHVSGEDEALHRLEGHKGVIFSISCDQNRGIIVTTSDDRSVRIWGPNNSTDHPYNSIQFWRSADLICKHELYGHTARVMRSCISIDKIISVGEDSAICFWNLDGSLAKKIVSHQNGGIWSVDADNNILVTGGGDGAVILHPFTVATDYCDNETLQLDVDTPKKLALTARRNLVIINEDNNMIYYNVEEKTETVYKLSHDSSYKLMAISSCKQMVAIADMNGKLDVFAENCKDTACLVNIIDTKLPVTKILSMQWAGNRFLVLCLDKGVVTVLASKESNSETYAEFSLPNCKERWLTASAVDSKKNIFVFGDRCGNIHVFAKGQKDPVKSFGKVHGRYGPTSITMKNDEVITTGRDGTVKYFNLDKNIAKLMSSKDLEFKWIEKFLDKEENIVCGFQERVFVVYDIKSNSKLLEVPCGGGHRSWDAIRYFEKVKNQYEEFIKLVYLKNSDINVVRFQLSKIVSKNIVNGSHSKEINCLKTHQNEDKSIIFLISGGEDTTLRISVVNSESEFKDLAIYKQLSSIRTLKTCPLNNDTYLVISGGGRAQICIKIVSFIKRENEIKVKTEELIDYMIKGTDKERKGNQNWRNCSVDFDPETRIMDVDFYKTGDDKFRIFAGCSDATLRVFTLSYNSDKAALDLTGELKYHKTCILKTTCINFMDRNILITCSTRGEVVFWDVTTKNDQNFEPIFVTNTNKSGINSLSYKIVPNDSKNGEKNQVVSNKLLITTGGDDNAIHLLLLESSVQSNLISLKILDSKTFAQTHSSEITGLCVVDDFIVSTSIDQRVSLFKWAVIGDAINCTFISQVYSDVADMQGMDVIKQTSSSITVCVFGKGLEVLEILTARE